MEETGALRIGGYEFSAKNLIVIGLLLVGLFFAYVIFLKPKASAGTTTSSDTGGGVGTATGGGGVAVTTDPSAVGSIQTGIESLQAAAAAQNQQFAAANLGGLTNQLSGIAATQQAQGGTLATINRNADSAARDASGSRTDASIALNGVNHILANQASGKGDSIGGATVADYWHLANAGLGA